MIKQQLWINRTKNKKVTERFPLLLSVQEIRYQLSWISYIWFLSKSSNSTGTSFPVTSSRTCWRRRQLPRNKLATSYEEVSDTPDHLDMSRWSESRQLPRNFLVTSWRLPRNNCYGEVTGKLVPVEFELKTAKCFFISCCLSLGVLK